MEVVAAGVSLFVGLFGGCLGAYIGMRVGLVRLETWRDIIDKNVNRLTQRVGVLGDDSLVHDMEIGALMQGAGKDRIRRQAERG